MKKFLLPLLLLMGTLYAKGEESYSRNPSAAEPAKPPPHLQPASKAAASSSPAAPSARAAPPSIKKDEIYTSGWFTGPIFGSSARTLAVGVINVEPYLSYYVREGHYGNSWQLQNATRSFSITYLWFMGVGIAENVEIDITVPWTSNRSLQHTSSGLSDTSVELSWQVMHEKYGGAAPNILVLVEQFFPIGNFRSLRPNSSLAQITGLGTFTTRLGVNFEKLFLMDNGRLFDLRVNLAYKLPTVAHVRGFNAYGGGFDTNGKLWVGSIWEFTLSYEVQLTQNWVFACDYLLDRGAAAKFSGTPGFNIDGTIATSGYPSWTILSVAPAIEYNFNENVGLLAGVWVSIAGTNNDAFISPTLALDVVF